MSTIDPTTIDPTKPTTGEALTADVRANEQATRDNFEAAKADIEALETGKEDAGTSAADVAAHDASAAAHGGVEANFGAHDGAGGSAHALAVAAGAAGFMAGADKTRLDSAHMGENHTGDVASAALVTTIQPSVVSNTKLAGAPANTLKARPVTAGNPTDLDIESLADGGVPAPTDVVLGKKAGGDLVKIFGANLGGGGGGGIEEAPIDGTPYARENGGWTGTINNVVEDASPALGGNLLTEGSAVVLRKADTTEEGRLVGLNGATPGSALAYTTDGGAHSTKDGAVVVEPGEVRIDGVAAEVSSLAHAEPGGRAVYVTQGGVLYGVQPPDDEWLESAESATVAALPNVGTWVDTGLIVTVPQDVDPADIIELSAEVHVVNTANQDGSVSLGFGVGANVPTAPLDADLIPGRFQGYLTAYVRTAGFTLATGQNLRVWAQIESGNSSTSISGVVNAHRMSASVGVVAGGGGEVNTSSTPAVVGANEADINMTKAGDDLPKRKLVGGSGVTLTQGADAITIAATGGGGSGDMVAPGSMGDGLLYASTNDGTGEQTAATTITASAVAQTNLANQFQQPQEFEDNGSFGGIYLTNTAVKRFAILRPNVAAYVDIAPTGGTPIPTADTGIRIHDDGRADALGTLQEKGNNVLDVGGGETLAATGGFDGTHNPISATFTPGPSTQGHYVKFTTNQIVNVPSATSSTLGSVANGVTLDLTAYGTNIKGAQASSGVSILQLVRIDGDSVAIWSD